MLSIIYILKKSDLIAFARNLRDVIEFHISVSKIEVIEWKAIKQT